MNPQFKVQDSVQLLHGDSPIMNLSQINEEIQQGLCVWFDKIKSKDIKQAWIPLNVLKHTPQRQPIDLDVLKKAAYRL